MIERRHFLGILAGLPALAAFPGAVLARAPDLSRIPARPAGPIEVLYRTPHGKPNGLDKTDEGLWVIDQGPENWISLIDPADGRLIREFQPSNVRAASGICVDEEDGTIWVGSTYNRLIVHLDPRTSRTIAAYQTPGAGLIYRMAGDVQGHQTPLEPAYPEAPRPASALPGNVARLPNGQVALDRVDAPPGTGAHCILQKGKLLYVAVPPARSVFVIDKTDWVVQDSYPSAGNRPHDMAWTDAAKTHFWASDSNLNAFFRQNATSGEIDARIQLPDDSPVIHGAKLHDGYMYCCDDVGWMFRFRM
jgi:hypothetical protein